MFTGIITDVGEVIAREGGRFAIRCALSRAGRSSSARSIACDGCCLTVTRVRADAQRQRLHGRRVERDAVEDDARRLAAGPQSISNARCGPATSSAGMSSQGTSTAWRASSTITPDGESRRFTFEVPEPLARFIAPKGSVALDGTSLTVNEVEGRSFGVNLIPHTLTQDDLGAQNARRRGQSRGRPVRALRGAHDGVSHVTHEARQLAISGRQGLPVLDRRDRRGHAQRPHGRARRRRGSRERGRPRHRRADGDARRDQLHGQARARADLPDADAGARAGAQSRVHGAHERARATAPPSRSRSRRAKASRPASRPADRARTIATAIDPTKGADDIVSPGHVFPLVAREGGVLIRAGHTEASVDLARLAGLLSGGRDLRDHERRRHHGAHAGPRAVRAAARAEDRHHRGSHRLPAAQRHARAARGARRQVESAYGGAFDLHVYATTVERRGASGARQGRRRQGAGPGAGARARRQRCCGDLLGIGEAADGTSQIAKSMRAIEKEGRGVIVLIRDLGPKSVSDWIGAAEAQPGASTSKGARAPAGRDRRRLADPARSRRDATWSC